MKFSLWGDKFWNGFCSPRHSGVFLIFFLVLVSIAYLGIYILIPIYYGAFSTVHNIGYLFFFCSNCLITLTGILMIGFLTMPSENTSFKRCIGVYICHLFCLLLGILGIILLRIPPGKSEMKRFIVDYFHEYYHSPRLLIELQDERNCCGITGLSDFFTGKVVRFVPPSCCIKKRRRRQDCGDFRKHKHRYKNGTVATTDGISRKELAKHTGFVTKGCFSGNLSYKDLPKLSPSVYSKFMFIINFAWINPFLILILTAIFSYYALYKLPIHPERPKWTDRFACCVKACCPKKIAKTESNQSFKRGSWRNSQYLMMQYERSELYVAPSVKAIPAKESSGEKEQIPNVSDVGSIVSSSTSSGGHTGSMVELMVS